MVPTKTTPTQIISEHKVYLTRLKSTFIQECEQITNEAKQKLTFISESDLTSRQKIFADQQMALNNLLAQLTGEISKANRTLLKTLEKTAREEETTKLHQMDQLIHNL